MHSITDTLKRFSRTKEAIDWPLIYQAELPKVFHFFCYRVGDIPLAEDLTATTFEKVWRSRDRYQQNLGTISNWLFGIARKVIADHFRHQKVETPLDDDHRLTGDILPEETVQQREEFNRLSKLLAQLPDREKELVALKYGADLTNRLIAKLTGLSESNVGTILYRVVSKLRSEWEQQP